MEGSVCVCREVSPGSLEPQQSTENRQVDTRIALIDCVELEEGKSDFHICFSPSAIWKHVHTVRVRACPKGIPLNRFPSNSSPQHDILSRAVPCVHHRSPSQVA